ncbi:MAG: nucleotide exchange factor GrpE [Alphaproteobacteria bacterium]|nr:nucleotide exchange factor GrpE [Alphaproteobacteria bacterium]
MTEPQPMNEEMHDREPSLEPEVALTARIAELEKQLAEMKDRALREMADAENTRKRAQKEREDTAKYAVANFAKAMLDVSDNFRRALDAVPKEDTDPALKNLMAGIEATERQLLAAFDRFGIKKIEPLGQPFDPNFHQVMMEVDDPNQPPGTVVQVLQAGYVIHDRLLREAMVAVSKGGASTHVDKSA